MLSIRHFKLPLYGRRIRSVWHEETCIEKKRFVTLGPNHDVRKAPPKLCAATGRLWIAVWKCAQIATVQTMLQVMEPSLVIPRY